jgi:hypothetical protein
MKKIILLFTCILVHQLVHAYDFPFLKFANTDRVGKTYLTNDDDGIIFSWTQGGGYTSNIRFSMILNTGVKYNYNLTSKLGIYTGLTMKNVGKADRINGVVSRARNYYVGVPFGMRIGNLRKKTEVNVGGGIDFTLHHKEKIWVDGDKRDTKQKLNCAWFDNKYSPFVNPYIFGSFKVNGLGLKYQYYLQPFFKNGNENLMFVSLLLDTGKGGRMGKANRKTKKIKKSINSI